MKKREKNESDNKLYFKFLKLLNLETATGYGRVNLAGVAIIAIFCIVYTASDFIQNIIQIIAAAVKSVNLQRNIDPSLEDVSVIEAVIPSFLLFILCLILLYKYEKRKLEIKEENEIKEEK